MSVNPMLLAGLNHVAVLTSDTDRLCAFYADMFGSTVSGCVDDGAVKVTFLDVGPDVELNVFEIAGNGEATRQAPMFERGRLDHFGLQAASLEAFEEIRDRLIACGASDGFVTDFGPVLSVFFRDPDGLEGEVCVANPDRQHGVFNPPGTPAARYAE